MVCREAAGTGFWQMEGAMLKMTESSNWGAWALAGENLGTKENLREGQEPMQN